MVYCSLMIFKEKKILMYEADTLVSVVTLILRYLGYMRCIHVLNWQFLSDRKSSQIYLKVKPNNLSICLFFLCSRKFYMNLFKIRTHSCCSIGFGLRFFFLNKNPHLIETNDWDISILFKFRCPMIKPPYVSRIVICQFSPWSIPKSA